MICHDPDTKKFTQVKESKRQGLHRVFHVKFFGGQRGKRAWVDQPHMLKFEGLEAFQELSNSATGSKQKAAFCPKYGNTKTIWLQAINECVSVVGKNDNMYKNEYSICLQQLKKMSAIKLAKMKWINFITVFWHGLFKIF